MYNIGIDLGGTNIAAGVVDSDGRIVCKLSRKTDKSASGAEIIMQCCSAAREALESCGMSLADIYSVGLCSPGAVDSERGVIEYANNLDFSNLPAKSIIAEALGKRVCIENDANAAAYGEFCAGSAKGVDSAVCITLGTGVGGGVIIDKKIYKGYNGGGGELGHMVIEVGGDECTCGRRGCFEVYSSATGLVRMTRQAMHEHPESLMNGMAKPQEAGARLAFEAARRDDPAACAVVNRYIHYLAEGCANIINIFQPQILCIGGGVSNEGDYLINPLRELTMSMVYTRRGARNTEIVRAALGNDAGIIGASLLYRLEEESGK